jgi:hypothetical protein
MTLPLGRTVNRTLPTHESFCCRAARLVSMGYPRSMGQNQTSALLRVPYGPDATRTNTRNQLVRNPNSSTPCHTMSPRDSRLAAAVALGVF